MRKPSVVISSTNWFLNGRRLGLASMMRLDLPLEIDQLGALLAFLSLLGGFGPLVTARFGWPLGRFNVHERFPSTSPYLTCPV
jgi:hypothetical protein